MLLSTDFPSIKNMQIPNNRNGVKVSYSYILGFPGDTRGKELPANAGDAGSIPEAGRFQGGRKWQPTPIFLPGKFHG